MAVDQRGHVGPQAAAGRGHQQAAKQPAPRLVLNQLRESLVSPIHGGGVQGAQDRIALQSCAKIGAAVGQDAAVVHLAQVAFDPIAQIKGVRLAVGAAAVGFDDKAFHAAQGVMVQLHQTVIVAAVVGKQPAARKVTRHIAARPVKPARRGGGVGLARAVDAHFGMAGPAIQCLEHLRAPWPGKRGGCCAREGFGHRAVNIANDARIAEHPPRQGDGIGLRQGGKQGAKGSVAGVDVHEFIDIGKQHPIGAAHQGMLACRRQGRPLRTFALWILAAQMGQPAQLLQPVQHGVGAIRAIIGKHKEMGEPHLSVMRQPFQQKGRFVLDRCDKDCLHGLA